MCPYFSIEILISYFFLGIWIPWEFATTLFVVGTHDFKNFVPLKFKAI